MIHIEELRSLKQLQVFEENFTDCIEILSKILSDEQVKNNKLIKDKQSCIFNKTIFIYYLNNKIIGFCMYQNIKNVCLIYLDYVNKKFKGCGRKCRGLVYKYIKKNFFYINEIVFFIYKKNYLSVNSVQKIINPAVFEDEVKVEQDAFSSKLKYTIVFNDRDI